MRFWLRTLLIVIGLTLPTLAAAHEHCAQATAMTQAAGTMADMRLARADRAVAVWTAPSGSTQTGCIPCTSSGHGAAGCDCMATCCAVPSSADNGARAAYQTVVIDSPPGCLTARPHQPPTPPPRA
ncbi:hypothetical protein [Oryzibacter oryziterrae]|uniref:hypothetical protein n=1 Tax=Oryzibacter oryziterrae TaxID=2766474 RepID=UPI001F1DCC4C|nr:hypothetical protein [Oryzibacter oryziterrae]